MLSKYFNDLSWNYRHAISPQVQFILEMPWQLLFMVTSSLSDFPPRELKWNATAEIFKWKVTFRPDSLCLVR